MFRRKTARELGVWTTDDWAGCPVDLFTPSTTETDAGVVLFLHGHDLRTPTDNPVWTDLFNEQGLRVICPHGGRSWWLEELTPEFPGELDPQTFLAERLVPEIANRLGIEPPKIGLCGVGVGGQGVLRLAYRLPRRFPVVVALSPAVDFWKFHGAGLPIDEMYSDAEAARQASVVLKLHPLDWPKHQWFASNPLDSSWHDGCERLAMKLSSSGILFESDLRTTVEGTPWDYFDHLAPVAVRFLREQLERVG